MPRPVNPTLTYDQDNNRLSFEITSEQDENMKAEVAVYPDPLFPDSALCVAIDRNLCLNVRIDKHPVTGEVVPVVELINDRYELVETLDIQTGNDSREKYVRANEEQRAINQAARA